MLKISNGATFEGFKAYIGLFILLIGAVPLVWSLISIVWEVALVFSMVCFFGAVLFMDIRGIVLDREAWRVYSYTDYILFKSGSWKNLDKEVFVVLGIYSRISRSTFEDGAPDFTSVRTTSYDIYLQGQDKILLKECSNYTGGIQIAKEAAEYLGCKIDDRIPARLRI